MATDTEIENEGSSGQDFVTELFPGIPDDITLKLIVPKLTWSALPILSSVNRSWEKAIRCKQVYEARVCANATETLIVHDHDHGDKNVPALYSTSENCCFELPPIPTVSRGALDCYECVAVDGKLYVMGGTLTAERDWLPKGWRCLRAFTSKCAPSAEVYVLDLAGVRGNWERCASMLEPRSEFGCGFMDGKIYVFGAERDIFACEVYDIKNNAWSRIMPIKKIISDVRHAAAETVQNELFVRFKVMSQSSRILTSGIYNPGKNELRLINRFSEAEVFGFWSSLFLTSGKFYKVSKPGIHVYDVGQKSWIKLHGNSFAGVLCDRRHQLYPQDVLVVKHEIFFSCFLDPDHHAQSFQSKGFDTEKKKLKWQKTGCAFRPNILDFMYCSIQL